ncbi:hypothetical protein GH714_040802 [Hevea brasiliensis]|uniref:Major facilitator superfamily (MFS) profile domain-containing protein n=1 Tax=Hevea brasiliensis TaxID=3981 RepID=A0A6A6MSK8_HEVBR|nr:hypothetical protein GH714_040802 [Hevea brasiliensis]
MDREILKSKWIATVASIWIQCSCGASYTFGIYSSILKSTQGYDQSTLDTVSVFKDIGANAGVLSGLLYSAVTLHRNHRRLGFFSGPWLVHAAGAIQCFIGYFVIWASVNGLIPRLPVPLMCLFMWVAAHAQTFFNTSNVVSGVHNFGDYGGTIVGIMKMYFVSNIIESYEMVPLGRNKLMYIIPRILLFLLASPLGIAVRAQRENSDRFAQALLEERGYKPKPKVYSEFSTAENPTDCRALPSGEGQAKASTGDRNPSDEEDLNLLQALGTVNFWLLFIATICGLGSGLATVNNISQVGESLGYTTIETNSLVSLWSIWNFLGRFGAGFVSDIFLHRGGWARPLFMVITLSTLAIGHMVIASGFTKCLYLGSFLVGVSYGSQWSLMPTICSEIFGVGHMGTIFNTIAIASPLGSYIFSVRVIGYIYDKASTSEDNTCFGTHCFMLSFLIMASVTFFGVLVALALFFRTRRFYQVVVLRRVQHS